MERSLVVACGTQLEGEAPKGRGFVRFKQTPSQSTWDVKASTHRTTDGQVTIVDACARAGLRQARRIKHCAYMLKVEGFPQEDAWSRALRGLWSSIL
eukprot:14163136-Alexandrium_andersonii.AAC.1